MVVYAAESERLWLQNLSVEDHLQDCFELMSSPAAVLWSTKPLHRDSQQTLDLMYTWMPTPAEPRNKYWAIMLRPESAPEVSSRDMRNVAEITGPKMIGILGTPRKGELAYKLSPDYWGKGYMFEAVEMFLRMWWAMTENAEFTRLTAGADPKNIASTRVLARAGFGETEGGYKIAFYERASEPGVKYDMQFFHLDRPSQ